MSSNGDSSKENKAQAKADKAFKKASRPWFKKKRYWALAIILIFAIGNSISGGGSSSTSSTQETASTETEIAAVAVTAEQLLSELEANALAAKNTWNDKKVKITGTLDNIDASGKYFSLRGDAEISFINVQIFIDDSFMSAVSSFKKGQSVTVTGQITDVGELLGYSVKAISIP